MLAVQADGHDGHHGRGARTDGELHPIQSGFKEEHGLQCGFCTPGMMLVGAALIERNPDPTDDEVRWAISGNLCRCTGYMNIVKAIQTRRRSRDAEERVMTSTTRSSSPTTTRRSAGSGTVVRRHEDARFIAGQGNYLDDLVLPGHAPHGDPARPWPTPASRASTRRPRPRSKGVVAVVTGELMAAARAGVDADAVGRHPGGARHRQGAVPGPGGRGRRRRPTPTSPRTRSS